MTNVSPDAKQLYDYMCYYRRVLIEDKSNRQEISLIYEATDEFINKYSTYLDELKRAGWIKGHVKRWYIVVGRGVITHDLYGLELDRPEKIQLLKTRYSSAELSMIDQAFNLFAKAKNKTEMTQLQVCNELEYYNKYPIHFIVESIKTYLLLRPDQQHGPQYLRGIIRRQAETSSEQQPSISQHNPKQVNNRPSQAHELRKLKAEYVNRQIDLTYYKSLTPEQQSQYIASLEHEFLQQHSATA